MHATNRREFLQTALAGLAMGSSVVAAQETAPGELPKRPLGKTGEKVTIIALGGWDIGNVKDDREAIQIMQQAVDEGLTFFDNCWDYHEGRSEELMGRALAEGGRRQKVFLMTKVCGRDYKTARQQLEDSLRRLQTETIDLWQFHGTQWSDDVRLIFDENQGAVKAALEARRAGKVRYLGFTGHKHPHYHLQMLKQEFDWDTVQMPLNLLDPHYRSFQKKVLPECTKRRIGAIGMKSLGAQDGRIPRELGWSAEQCRRYSLSLPIASLVCGIQSRENLQQDLAIARDFRPMTDAEIVQLLARTEEQGVDGHVERYKTHNYGCDWYHNNFETDGEKLF